MPPACYWCGRLWSHRDNSECFYEPKHAYTLQQLDPQTTVARLPPFLVAMNWIYTAIPSGWKLPSLFTKHSFHDTWEIWKAHKALTGKNPTIIPGMAKTKQQAFGECWKVLWLHVKISKRRVAITMSLSNIFQCLQLLRQTLLEFRLKRLSLHRKQSHTALSPISETFNQT